MALGAMTAGFIAGLYGYSIMYVIMAVFPVIGCIIFISSGRERISRYANKNRE
jgi:uncharacterized membrane protein